MSSSYNFKFGLVRLVGFNVLLWYHVDYTSGSRENLAVDGDCWISDMEDNPTHIFHISLLYMDTHNYGYGFDYI